MPSYFDYERHLMNLLEGVKAQLLSRPLNLGGIGGSGGGTGGPPGGFTGWLPQYRVAYDVSELATLAVSSGTQSLVDNLNRIRYRLTTLEETVGPASSLSVQASGITVASGVTVLNFVNSTVQETAPGIVIVSGTEGHTHSNTIYLDTINQNLGTSYSPTFEDLNITGLSTSYGSGTSVEAAIEGISSYLLSLSGIGTDALAELTDVSLTSVEDGSVIQYDINDQTWKDYALGVGISIVTSGNSLQIGNISSNSYVNIDLTTGTLTLIGDATTWDDLRISGSQARAGVTAPSLGLFGPSGSLRTLRFENNHHDEIEFEVQMPHSWKEGSNIYPHVHWSPTNTSSGNVVWEFDYAWANINGTFGSPSTMTSDPQAAGGVAWVHKLAPLKSGGISYIDGSGKTLSSMLVCRLHRNANSGSDTYAADAAFLEFDLHYQVDSFGSDQEYIKSTEAILADSDGELLTDSDGIHLTE